MLEQGPSDIYRNELTAHWDAMVDVIVSMQCRWTLIDFLYHSVILIFFFLFLIESRFHKGLKVNMSSSHQQHIKFWSIFLLFHCLPLLPFCHTEASCPALLLIPHGVQKAEHLKGNLNIKIILIPASLRNTRVSGQNHP